MASSETRLNIPSGPRSMQIVLSGSNMSWLFSQLPGAVHNPSFFLKSSLATPQISLGRPGAHFENRYNL